MMNQSYAWQYSPADGENMRVRFLDWPEGHTRIISTGESITVTQRRFQYCEGDNSETITNIGGELKLVRRMGEGCKDEVSILSA